MKTIFLTTALIFPMAAFAGDGQPGSHFIENWDLDANGIVTLAELTEKRGDVFYTFDSDDDGILTAEEYSYFDDARKGRHGKQRRAYGRQNGQSADRYDTGVQ